MWKLALLLSSEFKLRDVLRDGLCGSCCPPSVQSPRVPVIVRVTGVFLPVRIAGIFVPVRIAVILPSPVRVAATAVRLWIQSTGRKWLRVNVPHAPPRMHRPRARAAAISLSTSAGVRCSRGLVSLFGRRIGGEAAAPLPGARNGNISAEAMSRISQMRGLVRGAVVVATRRRFALTYLIPREISNAEEICGAGRRGKIAA
jgi:hypothetical protein